ncbi:sugar ABC transporter substrate-binding protein [Conexibacter sp. CPCC 206217]|uniref:sugar ABC transporter substrate-binding protein n=1 Tax=Conexibacter sp. CPCC 206217 TaxID=3064574 RepID=UPI0027208782|nr:sugar ABC transporter substrate-binding protein [Conexibacter sp. CPCC 206217]MDO8212225.1 sugar ABC transporter substrate-binding protein [Conexibacter sp. CPCC 206217]
MRKHRFGRVGALAGAVAVIALAGCGSDSSSGGSGSTGSSDSGSSGEVSVDVGTGTPVKVSGKPRIAFYIFGGGNAYGVAERKGALRAAADYGVDVTLYDGAFDAQKQFNQVQTAINSGRFNAFSLDPVDANLVCNLASRTAPARGIVVSVFDQPLCGRYAQPTIEGLWQPGTLNFVAGYFTIQRMHDWLEAIVREFPGPQKVGLITGLAVDSLSKDFDSEVERVKQEHPEFEVAGEQRTDYTTTKGYAAAQTLLQANPDLTLIISDYSDLTVGASKAIEQAGKSDQVKLADFGGSSAVTRMVQDGSVALTTPTYPYSEATNSIKSLVDAFEGKRVPRVGPLPFKVYTRDNIASYRPEF